MKIGIIGAGNVATQLALGLNDKNNIISGVFNRDINKAKELAAKVNSVVVTHPTHLIAKSDLIIISINDDAIEQIAKEFPHDCNTIIVHTAGSVEMSVFAHLKNYGVLYPLQTFTKESTTDLILVPFLIEANNEPTQNTLTQLANQLSRTVKPITSSQRQLIHVAAAFSCNFVNHLYTLSSQFLNMHQIDFELLKPLINETTQKALSTSPYDAQTGPAIRNDTKTISKHLTLLQGNKSMKEIYNILTNSITNTYRYN